MGYSAAPFARPTGLMVTTVSPECSVAWMARAASSAAASVAWPANDQGVYVPVVIPQAATFVKAFWANGASVSGNVDVGLYTEAFARVASTGSTAQSGTSNLQEVDITDFTVPPGRYYLALSCSTTAATFTAYSAVDAARLPNIGVLQESSALPLPATATPVAVTQLVLPIFGFARRTLVA